MDFCCLIKNLLTYIIVPGAVSYCATKIFWDNSFKSRSTQVEFAKFIGEKEDGSVYIRLINSGKMDLIDVKYIVQLRYKQRVKDGGDDRYYNITLKIGEDNSDPVIYGEKKQKKDRGRRYYWNKEICLPDDIKQKFSKQGHPEVLKEKELQLSEILREYGECAQFAVYVYGIDTATGVERMFKSPSYNCKNIRSYKCFISEPYSSGSFSKYCARILQEKHEE